jgi:hypothetical protein
MVLLYIFCPTCRRVALGLTQNQHSRHDFKALLSALFVSWPAELAHAPLRNVGTYPGIYHAVK